MFILAFIVTCVVLYWLWSRHDLKKNVRKAEHIGILCVSVQVDGMIVLWLVFEPYFCFLLDFCQISSGDFKRYARRGCF